MGKNSIQSSVEQVVAFSWPVCMMYEMSWITKVPEFTINHLYIYTVYWYSFRQNREDLEGGGYMQAYHSSENKLFSILSQGLGCAERYVDYELRMKCGHGSMGPSNHFRD